MNNIILCEGFDDSYILGYYIFKTIDWKRSNKPNFPKEYKFPKINRNQSLEYYYKNDDKLAIWSIGGKDSLDNPFKFISQINQEHPKLGISNLFIILDRDELSLNDHLISIQNKLNEYNIDIKNLNNNESTEYSFTIEDENFILNIIPMIIPFDEEGAVETILIKAIGENSIEDKFIVENAINYVDEIKSNGKITSYLNKERLILKSKFSSVISITNPDRSTATFDKLLTSHDWEKSNSIKEYFKTLDKYL